MTVWCGFWDGGLIGFYFFKDSAGNTVTMNGERYNTIISDFLWLHLKKLEIGMDLNMKTLWLQQHGATCHISRDLIALLREKFLDRHISLGGDKCWPPQSCDLTPYDFFFIGLR